MTPPFLLTLVRAQLIGEVIMTLQEAHLLTNRTFTYNVGGELGTYLTDSELGVVDMDGDIQCFTYIREKIDPYINNYH